MEKTCVVGIGSPHGDDRIGWLIADQISAEVLRCGISSVTVRRAGSPAQILDWLEDLKSLLLIDACRGLDLPGSLLQLDWPAQEMQAIRGSGSHDYSVWQTLELADRLGTLPPRCRIWCVSGKNFGADASLSPSLLVLIPNVVDDVIHTLTN